MKPQEQEQQIIDLQFRLTDQEEQINQLNMTVVRQQQQLDDALQRLELLQTILKEIMEDRQETNDVSRYEIPPHY